MPMAVTSMPPPKHTSFCPMPGAIMPDKNTPAPAVITISPAPTSEMNNISKRVQISRLFEEAFNPFNLVKILQL